MRTRALRSTRPAHRRTAAAAALLMLSAGLAACSSSPTSDDGSPAAPGDTPGASEVQVHPVRLTTSFADPGSVPIDAPVTVSADGGDLSDVRVTSAAGLVQGRAGAVPPHRRTRQ